MLTIRVLSLTSSQIVPSNSSQAGKSVKQPSYLQFAYMAGAAVALFLVRFAGYQI